MTFAQLKTLASVWLDDTAMEYFTSTQLGVWLNNAQRELQKKLLNAGDDYYTVCASASTVANQARYAFPDNFLKIMRLSYVTNDTGNPDTSSYQQLFPIQRNEQNQAMFTPTGDPTVYYYNKDVFVLVPCPTRVIEMHLDYAYRIVDMVDASDEPDAPEDYHEYIAIMAARDGFLRDGRDMNPIDAKLGYFEKLLKENAQQRKQDLPRSVVSVGDSFSWS